MVSSRTQARDDILALLKAAAVYQSTALTIIYDDSKVDRPNTGTWLRANVKHGRGSRAAIGPGAIHTQEGILFVQIFTEAGNGLAHNDAIAKLIEDAFRGKYSEHGVVFRDVVTKEIGQDGIWFQSNVEVDFEYDLVGA